MINPPLEGKSKLILNKDYSKISVYIHGDYDVTNDMIRESMMRMAEPYMETEDGVDGAKIISLSVTNSEYKENTDRYIKYLEDTLDGLGITVHRDVKGEIYLGSKGVDPSAK